MATIHFLNVLEGDCNIIQHDSGRVSVIDVCNASDKDDTPAEKAVRNSLARKAMYSAMPIPTGKKDYGQKKLPENPIPYLQGLSNKNEVFRFIVTHPDMDHLDGIRDFFSSFSVQNIWDTENKKEIEDFNGGGYNKEDWDFYKAIRGGKSGITRLANYANDMNNFWNEDKLHILSPTEALIKTAIENDDYNDSSYVLLFTPPKKGGGTWKILFGGDSHDGTWESILGDSATKSLVTNVDVLIAPHHGRDSSRDYKFLDVLKPRYTLFGNAKSSYLAYDKYPQTRITNNQAGSVIIKTSDTGLHFYVRNKEFANDYRNDPKRKYGEASYDASVNAYYIESLVIN